MSDFSQGPGWWQASDGKWYPPEQAPQGPAPGAGNAVPTPMGPGGQLADWGQRAVGIVIDWALLLAIFVVGAIVAVILGLVADALGLFVFFVVYIAVALGWIYYGFLVGAAGRSPGMALTGLKCVSQETGQVIGGGMGIVRHFAHIIDSIICYVGWLFPLWDPQRQTIADKLVKTVVIADQPKQSFSAELFKP
jgi:uncharacterized RDD family membrane protein YckC